MSWSGGIGGPGWVGKTLLSNRVSLHAGLGSPTARMGAVVVGSPRALSVGSPKGRLSLGPDIMSPCVSPTMALSRLLLPRSRRGPASPSVFSFAAPSTAGYGVASSVLSSPMSLSPHDQTTVVNHFSYIDPADIDDVDLRSGPSDVPLPWDVEFQSVLPPTGTLRSDWKDMSACLCIVHPEFIGDTCVCDVTRFRGLWVRPIRVSWLWWRKWWKWGPWRQWWKWWQWCNCRSRRCVCVHDCVVVLMIVLSTRCHMHLLFVDLACLYLETWSNCSAHVHRPSGADMPKPSPGMCVSGQCD
jgi:hypothetical protein